VPTKREAVIGAMLERLAAITKANGFATDAGATLHVNEHLGEGPDDPASGLMVLIGDEGQNWQQPGLACIVQLPITVAAITKTALTESWKLTEALIGDVQRAMELEDRHLNKLLCQELIVGPVRAYQRDAGSDEVGSTVTYVATFKRGWGTP
jgi:hypothetical protein